MSKSTIDIQNIKDTLNLPSSTFAMRGNLMANEPIRYKRWDEEKKYQKMANANKGKRGFTLHDGPPYANGNIHIGHALNKILKDIVVKYNYFNGKDVSFTPGWDCHGLPIEQKVEEHINKTTKNFKELSILQIRELCYAHATEFVGIQEQQFKNLGVLSNFDNKYLTLQKNYESDIYNELVAICKNDLLIQRSKPVYWSWSAQSALAEAEIEYKDKESNSIYVAFKLKDNKELSNAKLVIWTTTPWTLLANEGISLHPDEEYIVTDDNFIVAKKLLANLKELGVVSGNEARKVDQKELENTYAINPLNDRDSKIMLGEHVTMDSGTGCVHTAPGHGEDDYKIGLKYNLEVTMPISANGTYDESVREKGLAKNPDDFVGKHIYKSEELIMELLGDALLYATKIKHSYPYCWRTSKPVIYRATKQWFIALDKPYGKDGKTLRERALSAIADIEFYPASGKNRLKSMIEARPDWCISRQRKWGVPIAFFINKNTKEVIKDNEVLEHIAEIFKTKGTNAWYEMSIEELLPKGSELNPDELEKTLDILDVWFESGSSQNAVLKNPIYEAGEHPADVYLEGSDQHRGWFQASLLVSLASSCVSPFKTIITHGFTMDAKGEKMSKSKGNVIDPDKIIKQFGGEILRLWVGMVEFSSDQKISNEILKQISEQYRKIRNTARYLLSNTGDLDEIIPLSNKDAYANIDKWILQRAKIVFDEVDELFGKYEYALGFNKLNSFLVSELSNVYLDVCKDKLYCDSANSKSAKASKSAMALIAQNLIHALAPVLTYTCDEIIEHAPKVIKGDAGDIFEFSKTTIDGFDDSDMSVDMDKLVEIKKVFNENIENLKANKVIKSTLELVVYSQNKDIFDVCFSACEDWLIVSEIVSSKLDGEVLAKFSVGDDEFEIYKSNKHKCPRCWKLNTNSEDELCSRCDDAVAKL